VGNEAREVSQKNITVVNDCIAGEDKLKQKNKKKFFITGRESVGVNQTANFSTKKLLVPFI